MTTQVELAYRALHQILTAAVLASPACPDVIYRNRTVNALLSGGAGAANASGAYMNLVDAKGRFLSEEVTEGGGAGHYEIVQPAALEIIVVDPDDEDRDAAFDAIMEVLAGVFADIDSTLGGLVDDVSVTEPPDRMLLAGADSAKAARIMIDMTMTLPTVFG